jgi:DMSO/TMAO reductase YedYZ molybdopterin-dependent catalytic subunit
MARGTNAEMRWSAMRGQGYLTPIDRFFVRNHTSTPRIDVSTWRLHVHGTGVERELSLSYDDLVALPQVSVTRFIECAGNGRSLFGTQQGQAAAGTAWTLGAVGVAEWTGIRLSTVLERAGLRPSALDVMPVGLDDQQVRRPVPLEKALADDTLIVLGMNGHTLPPDHGFPARILVPGWVGVANIKWVGSIEVSETPLTSPWNTTSYRLFGPAYPDSPLVTTQVVKSALEQPLPAPLRPGPHRAHGPVLVGPRPDLPPRNQRRRRSLARRAARAPKRAASLADVVSVMGGQTGRPRRPRPRHRRARKRPAGHRALQRAGLPVRCGG